MNVRYTAVAGGTWESRRSSSSVRSPRSAGPLLTPKASAVVGAAEVTTGTATARQPRSDFEEYPGSSHLTTHAFWWEKKKRCSNLLLFIPGSGERVGLGREPYT